MFLPSLEGLHFPRDWSRILRAYGKMVAFMHPQHLHVPVQGLQIFRSQKQVIAGLRAACHQHISRACSKP